MVASGPALTVGCEEIVTVIVCVTSPAHGNKLVACNANVITPVSFAPG